MFVERTGDNRQVRFTAALALAITLAACTAAPPATYSDPRDQWSITYPAAMFTVTSFDSSDRVTDTGVWVANYDAVFDEGYGGLDAIPNNGIALRIWRTEGGAPLQPASMDSAFPLNTNDFVPDATFGMIEDPVVTTYEFQGDGIRYRAGLWTSSGSSDSDRSAMADIVGSLQFPSLEQGTIFGPYYVLGVVDDYQAGSVTRIEPGDFPPSDAVWRVPFFVVHAPNGIYALGFGRSDQQNGYRDCPVVFDPNAFEFTCPDIGARWDRLGNVVTNPDPSRYMDDPLQVPLLVIAHDNRVLVDLAYDLGSLPDTLWP
jgi:hypothetical protein